MQVTDFRIAAEEDATKDDVAAVTSEVEN